MTSDPSTKSASEIAARQSRALDRKRVSLLLLAVASVLGAWLFLVQDQSDVLDGTPVAGVVAVVIGLLVSAAIWLRRGLGKLVMIVVMLALLALVGFQIALSIAFQDG